MPSRRSLGLLGVVAALGAVACDDDLRVIDQPVADSGLPECGDTLPSTIEPEKLRDGLVGSEDLAIDASGNIVARQGDAVVKVRGEAVTPIVDTFPGSAGLRFLKDGSLAVAIFTENRVAKLSPTGESEDLLADLPSPNGVWADREGRVWITGTGSASEPNGKLVVVDADGTSRDVATGLTLPNGVVYDAKRKVVFFDELGGAVYRVAVNEDGFGEKVQIATLAAALPDGATLDACGNLYVIGFGSRKLYRLRLDDAGDTTQEPEEIAEFPGEVANPVFARGLEPTKLYVTGAPGDVYGVDVGALAADDNAP